MRNVRFAVKSSVCILMAVLLLILIMCGHPAYAWFVPDGSGSHAECDADDYYQGYHCKPHAYIIERAIEILRNDGKENWAAVASECHQDLMDGARWADRYGEQLRLVIKHHVLFGLIGWDTDVYDICRMPQLEHYYDPIANKGLDLSGWFVGKTIETALLHALSTYLTYGLYVVSIRTEPDIQMQPYPSAAQRCQEKYDLGLKAYNFQVPNLEGRSNLGTAMFYLGWACHYLNDCGVAPHTFNSFIGHDAYEEIANHKGHDPSYNAWNGGVYNSSLSARGFATAVAKEARKQKGLYEDDQWEQALKNTIPYTERCTAGMIANFLMQMGVSPKVPALAGQVFDYDHKPVPNAYIYYREPHQDDVSGKGAHAPWSVAQADAQGKYTLNLRAQVDYSIRPVMPGYTFEGSAAGEGGGLQEFMKESPVTYRHQGGLSAPRLVFYMKRTGDQKTALLPKTTSEQMLKSKPWLEGQLSSGLTTAATSIAQTLPDSTHKALLEVEPGAYRLGVENSKIDTPKETLVTVRLRHLLDVKSGKILQDIPEMKSMIDARRAEVLPLMRASALNGGKSLSSTKPSTAPDTLRAGQPTLRPRIQTEAQQITSELNPVVSPQAAKLMLERLPVKEVVEGGKTHKVLYFPAECGGRPLVESVLKYGLVPLPAPAGARIEVRSVSGYGRLDAEGSQPLVLTTNNRGEASFRVKAGNRGGKMIVQVKVLSDPINVQYMPSKTISFEVQPDWKGPDPTVEKRPRLEPVGLTMQLDRPTTRPVEIRPDDIIRTPRRPIEGAR